MKGLRSRPKPRRRLGQNFLKAQWAIGEFAKWACRFRKVVEIGAGTGAITSRAGDCHSVEVLAALEVDGSLIPELSSVSFFNMKVVVIHSDATRPPLRMNGFDSAYGSIPYSITGPLLSLLAKHFQKPALLLLQREVARRLASQPGSEGYGRITVIVRAVYDVRLGRVVPPSAFYPRPKVFSQFVELAPRRSVSPDVLERLEELTRCFFSQRRRKAIKVAPKCLKKISLDDVAEIFGERRVYEIPPETFLELASSSG
ncbi:MAG: 16S rRNA (adenine(1518)-N(6)/adenine(1519)-N(6))-dimethyltransferase RsmA [Thermoproteota archaeon]